MQGNLHVPFLGGWVGAIPPGYPAHEETYGNATRLVPTQLRRVRFQQQVSASVGGAADKAAYLMR
jgi:hypothetical protein